MIRLLAEAAATNSAANEGSTIGAALVAIVLGLLAIAFVKHIVDGTPANQPPDFRPIVPGDNALIPPPGDPSASAREPVNVRLEIDQLDIVDVPSTDRTARGFRN